MSEPSKLNELPVAEQQDLARHESAIEQALKSYRHAGNALRDIRDLRLYRATHSTFGDYCQVRWRTGDYSIVGFEDQVAVERKSVADLRGCMGFGRQRFERELTRLQSFDFSAVVCEGDLKDLVSPGRSRIHPSSVIGTWLAWNQRFSGTHWIFAPSRNWAAKITFRILDRFHRDSIDGKRPRKGGRPTERM